MKPFPGEIHKRKNHAFVGFYMDEEQEEWFRYYYPTIENRRISEAMGISESTVFSFAQRLGIKKSKKGLDAIRRRSARKAANTNRENGLFEKRKGKPFSDEAVRGLHKLWQDIREGKRKSSIATLRETNPRGYEVMLQKKRDERRELIRKETLRAKYGLERKTKLRMVVVNPYLRSQKQHRYDAVKKGYILAEDCSEGSPDRYVIYYDKDTKRGERFERNCIKDGFHIKEWVY